MTAILLISLLIFLASALIIARWQRKPSFRDSETRAIAGRALFEAEEPKLEEPDTRAMIIARAEAGDLSALIDSNGAQLYGEALERLLEWSRGDVNGERLTKITSFILANDSLRTNSELAGLVTERWLSVPATQTLPQTLRLAALSDDAGSFERSIDAVMQCRRQGRLADMTAGELRTLIEAEYSGPFRCGQALRKGKRFEADSRSSASRSRGAARVKLMGDHHGNWDDNSNTASDYLAVAADCCPPPHLR